MAITSIHIPYFSRQVIQYISFYGDQSYTGLVPAQLGNVLWRAPIDFTVRDLQWTILGNAGSGKSWTLTLMNNFTDTILTSTIDGDSNTGSSTSEVTVATGDRVIWKLEGETGEPAPAKITSITFEREALANQ